MSFKTLCFSLCLLFLKIQYASAQSLKVISYNIHHGADQNEINTLEKMGEFIRDSNADLVGLQEVDSVCNRSGNVDQLKVLAEISGMHYAFLRHFEYDGGAYGLGVLSKHPIISQQNGRITSIKNGEKKSLALLATKISLPEGVEMLFATVHFALDQATRLIQVSETMAYLDSDLPVVITGDLNATPETTEMKILSQGYVMADENLGSTFPVVDPIKKIDYIWVSKKYLLQSPKIQIPLSINYSDHLPLVANFLLKNNEQK